MSLMTGSEDVQVLRRAMTAIDGLDPLQKFVLASANVDREGRRLTDSNTILEGVLFAVWLDACTKLGVRPSDPNMTVEGQPI